MTPTMDVPCQVTVTVANQGLENVADPFGLDWYDDPDTTPVSTTTGTLAWTVNGLAMDVTYDVTSTYTFTTPGTHHQHQRQYRIG